MSSKKNSFKFLLLAVILTVALSACGTPAAPAATDAPAAPAAFGQASCAPNCAYKDMVMCYPQLGAESDWRTANTASFKDQAAKTDSS